MENTITFATRFNIKIKIKRADMPKFIKVMEHNPFSFEEHPCAGFFCVKISNLTIITAYTVKQLLKNINVYD